MSSLLNTNPTELGEDFENFISITFYCVGSIAIVPSFVSFYLLAMKSSFLPMDIRILMFNQQIQAFFNNVHFCILFTPFIYPYVGGGFCTGVLCKIGVKFHFSFCVWILSTVLLCASFIVLLFARYQSLLPPYSRMRIRYSWQIAFYLYIHASLLLIPIAFFLSETPQEIMNRIVKKNEFDWIVTGKVFGAVNGPEREALRIFMLYSILGNMIIFGTVTMIICVLTLRVIISSKTMRKRLSFNETRAFRAKVKNTVVVLAQMLAAISVGIVPICIMIAIVGIGSSRELQKVVIICELFMAFISIVISMILIAGTKQYVELIRRKFNRSSIDTNVSFSNRSS